MKQANLIEKWTRYAQKETEKSLEKAKATAKLGKKNIVAHTAAIFTGDVDNEKVNRLAAAATLGGRVMLSGVGAGMIATFAPLAKIHLQGAGTFWHGTPMEHIEGIVDKGLQTSYAGRMKRFNSKLMLNKVLTLLENYRGTPFSTSEMLHYGIRLNEALETAAEKGEPVVDKVIEEAKRIAKELNVSESKIESLGDELYQAGKRIYFGKKPVHVREWSTKGTEAAIAANKLLRKLFGSNIENLTAKEVSRLTSSTTSSLVNLLVGGWPNIIKNEIVEPVTDALQRAKAKKIVVNDIKEVPSTIRKLVEKGEITGAHKLVLGVTLDQNLTTRLSKGVEKTGLKTLGAFKDFPVIGPILSSSAALREVVSNFLPNYSPNRDISIAADIPAKNIHTLVLYEPETLKPTHVIQVKNSVKKVFGRPTLKNLAKAAIPLALTYIGGEILTKSLTGKTIGGHIKSALKKESVDPATKAALSLGAKGALGGALLVGGPLAAYLGAEYLASKALRSDKPGIVSRVGGSAASTASFYGSTGAVSPKLVSAAKAGTLPVRSLGFLGGAGIGATGSVTAQKALLNKVIMESLGEETPTISWLPKKLREKALQHSTLISYTPYVLPTVLTPAALLYVARKYYPYHTTAPVQEAMKNLSIRVTSAPREELKKVFLVEDEVAKQLGVDKVKAIDKVIKAAAPIKKKLGIADAYYLDLKGIPGEGWAETAKANGALSGRALEELRKWDDLVHSDFGKIVEEAKAHGLSTEKLVSKIRILNDGTVVKEVNAKPLMEKIAPTLVKELKAFKRSTLKKGLGAAALGLMLPSAVGGISSAFLSKILSGE